MKGLQAEKEALSSPWKPKNERELSTVFHQNGRRTVSAKLIAPGSRLVGFGPIRTRVRICAETYGFARQKTRGGSMNLDFDFLDEFLGRFLTPNSLLSEP